MEEIFQSLALWYHKFSSAVWRNGFKIWRNKGEVFWELLYPALVILMLVFVRTIRFTLPYQKITLYPQVDLKWPKTADQETVTWKIAFSPQPECIKDLMSRVVAFSENYPDEEEPDPEFEIELDTEILNSAVDLENYLTSEDPDDDKMKTDILAGVEFPDAYDKLAVLPEELMFALRFPGEFRSCSIRHVLRSNWHTDKLGDVLQFDRYDDFNETSSIKGPNYINEGFILLQHMISCSVLTPDLIKLPLEPKLKSDEIIMEVKREYDITLMKNITTNRFPHPTPPNDPMLDILHDNMSMFLLLAMLYPCVAFAQMAAQEKESRHKEFLRIMGLSIWMYWTTWFIAILSVLFLSMVLVVLLLKTPISYIFYRAVFPEANPLVLFTFLFIYAISSICFSFMIAALSEKVSTVGSMLPLMWFLSYLPYFYLYHAYSSLSFIEKCLLCIFPNTAMAYGFDIFVMYEYLTFGVHWDNVSYLLYDDFNLGVVMLILMLDSIFYLVMAFYIDEIYPHVFGRYRYFFHCCCCYFWGCYTGVSDGFLRRDNMRACPMQPNPKNVAVAFQHVTKEHFTKKCDVISNLHFDIADHDVTIIIGRSGTGKTLVLDLITGMARPTSGKIIVSGYNLKWNTSRARRLIGYAPQRVVLFDKLTVMEHLEFFAYMKSRLFKREVTEDNHRLLRCFAMDSILDFYPCQIGPVRRKLLSILIALSGNSLLVLLDEPMSGLPCTEENIMWNLIQSERLQANSRTIVITSYNLSDVSHGDRVALMEYGRLVVLNTEEEEEYSRNCESLMFELPAEGENLDNEDNNYYLTLGKDKCCYMKKATKLIQKYIPRAHIDTVQDQYFSYKLNLMYQDQFEQLFCQLEEESNDLGITSYSISTCVPNKVIRKSSEYAESCDSYHSDVDCECIYHPHLIGICPSCIQIYALFKKKLLYICRHCVDYIFLFLLSSLVILLTVFVIKAGVYKKINLHNLPPMLIVRENYKIFKSVSNSPQADYGQIEESYFAPLIFFMDQMQKLYYSVPPRITEVNITDKEINEFILEEYKYCTKGNPYQCGNTINGTRCVAWHNRYIYHSLPLAMNLLHICDLRNMAYRSGYNILVINKPLKFKKETMDYFRNEKYKTHRFMKEFKFPIVIALAYCASVISAYMIMFYIQERASSFKFQQVLNNVGYVVYWTTGFIIDILIGIISCLLFYLLLNTFVINEQLYLVIPLLCLFYVNILPVVYLCSFFFVNPRNGFNAMLVINLYFGILLFMFVELINVKNTFTEDFAKTFQRVFLIFPCFNLCFALRKLINIEYAMQYCDIICEELEIPNCDPCLEDRICCNITDTVYSWKPGIYNQLITFPTMFAILIVILCLYEYTQFGCLKDLRELLEHRSYCGDGPCLYRFRSSSQSDTKRINSMNKSELDRHALVVKNMSKDYRKGRKYHTVLDGLYLRVKPGDCVAVIGKPNSGKTTFCQLLTSEKVISRGDAFMYGYSVTRHTKVTHQLIGYCPENNPYMEHMTVRETLVTLSLIRGISMQTVTCHVEKIAKTLKFENDLDTRVLVLNEGTRRKFTIGVAMIGEPDILILDEPTRGLNSSSIKLLFRLIHETTTTMKRTIIMTGSDAREISSIANKIIHLDTAKLLIKPPKTICGTLLCEPCKPVDSPTVPGLTITITVCEREETRKSRKCKNRAANRRCIPKDELDLQVNALTQADLQAVSEYILDLFPCAIASSAEGRTICFVVPIAKQISQRVPDNYVFVIKRSGTCTVQFWEVYSALERARICLNIENYTVQLCKRVPKDRMYLCYDKSFKGLGLCNTCDGAPDCE